MTEQNDGQQWTAPGSAPAAPDGEPSRPKKKRRWLLYGGAALVVVIIIGAIAGGSKKDEGTVAAAAAATTSAGPSSTTTTSSRASTTPSSSAASTSSSAAPTTRTTPSSTSSAAPPPLPPTTSEEPAYVPIETKTYTGSGDDVIDVEKPADSLVLMTFTCAACDSNVALKSDYDLYVNEIGAYSGTRVLTSGYDTSGADSITMEVTANADWTLVTSDLTTASRETSGVGDSVILITDGTKAAVTHDGESNFAVKAYTSNFPDLLVNEIGPYTGTVRVRTPTLIEITADGNWTFAVS